MSTLGQRIRGAREQNQLTQGELGKKLGTSTAVISNWEKDINKPDAEKLPRLCQVLEVSAAYLLDYWEGEDPFTTEEWRRVKQFRLLDSHGKKMVDLVLAEEYARMTRHESDAAGQAGENLTYINCYDLAASAGTGEPLDNTYYKTRLEIPTQLVPEEAHYCLRVNGNSMEPAYKNGDIVFVERLEGSVAEGEVGIFYLNGEGFIKRLGKGALLSLNPAYPPIPIGPFDRLDCQGRVLGKL